MNEVETLIYKYDGQQRSVLLYLHNLLTTEFNLTARVTFNSPCFYGKSWICYLKPTKQRAIELTFFRGNELSNIQGLLQSKGRKQLSSIDIDTPDSIPRNALKEILHEAVLLDKTTPYESKRKLKKRKQS